VLPLIGDVNSEDAAMSARGAFGKVVVITFDSAILDADNIHGLKQELFALAEERPAKLVLNFRNVEYVSSAAMGVLITLHKRMQTAGGSLVLSHLDRATSEFLQLAKLDRFFRIEDAPVADEGVELRLTSRPAPAPSRQQKQAPDDPVILPFPSKE
jgi:anti-sigma B factor antagonist